MSETASPDPCIDLWDCVDCEVRELDRWEKQVHEDLTDHPLVARPR